MTDKFVAVASGIWPPQSFLPVHCRLDRKPLLDTRGRRITTAQYLMLYGWTAEELDTRGSRLWRFEYSLPGYKNG